MFPPASQRLPPPGQNEPSLAHSKPNLKTWWNHFNFVQKTKKDAFEASPYKAHDTAEHPVFGKPLKDSLRYASVQISTANANGDLYVWGYIPVVVAKCGLYLKENATEIPGTFRVNGSNKRMRDLQAAFETPPRYGKSLDWKQETYTTHDVASVFRRYLTQMSEPVIPYDMYHLFRDALAKKPFNQEEVIATYKSLIRRMPRPNQYLLLYVLDLLSVFARKSDKNLMTSTNLAVIFRPGLISHPKHEMSPQEHALSQQVLEFLIAHQDWFMLDIIPPPPSGDLPGDEGYGGGYGGPSQGGGGPPPGDSGGGGGGKWREGTSTPVRQNTADSTWNAEAGPSSTRTTTRQRVISGGPDIGTWYAHGSNGGGSTSRTIGSWAAQVQPHQLQRSDRRMSAQQYPYQPHQHPQSPQPQTPQHRQPFPQQPQNSYFPDTSDQPPSNQPLHAPQDKDGQGQTHGFLSADNATTGSPTASAFVTPSSSMPPSPTSSAPGHGQSGGSSHGHSQQYQQPHQQSLPRNVLAALPPSQSAAFVIPPVRTLSPLEASLPQYPQPQSQAQPASPRGTRPQPIHTGSASLPSDLRQHTRSASSPQPSPIAPLGSGFSDVDDVMEVPHLGEEVSQLGGGAWKLVSLQGYAANAGVPSAGGGKKGKERGKDKEERVRLRMMRRRTTMDRNELLLGEVGYANDMTPIQETSSSTEQGYSNGNGHGIVSVSRSRTLPSRRKGGDEGYDDKENSATERANGNPNAREKIGKSKDREHGERRVLKKQRRVSAGTKPSTITAPNGMDLGRP